MQSEEADRGGGGGSVLDVSEIGGKEGSERERESGGRVEREEKNAS